MDGRGSKQKGNRFELRIASIFSGAFDMGIRRVPASGGLDIKCDLYCPEDDTFPYYIECKHRETFRVQSVLELTSDLFEFFERNSQMSKKSYLMQKYAHVSLKPIVVFKGGDFKSDMVMTDIPPEEGLPFVYMAIGNLYIYKLVDFIGFCDKERLR